MTTERPDAAAPAVGKPRRKRASKASLRAAAWVAAGASLAGPFVGLELAPRPAAASADATGRRVVIVHRTIRRVVIDPAAPRTVVAGAPSVRYVVVGGGTVSSGGSAATTRCSGC
jgi:hypothetical protein